MALVVKDRVRVTSTTAGTGTITLGAAVQGFQSFSVIGDGNTTYYGIVDSTTGDWEVGIGTYTASGTTLSRDTVLESSNSGSLVSFLANPKDVFVTYPAERSVYVDAANATADVPGITVGAGTVSAPSITTTGDTNTGIYFPAADTIGFVEGGVEAMRIDSSGRVGVGTSSPAAQLDVSGGAEIAVLRGTSDSRLRLVAQASGTSLISFDAASPNAGGINYAHSTSSMQFVTAFSERMRITSGGNVGIGTNSPLTRLHVMVSDVSGYASVANDGIVIERTGGTAALNIATDNNRAGAIWFADGDAAAQGQIVYEHSSDALYFGTNNAERMRITSSGNVGIGTSSPTLPLTIGPSTLPAGVTVYGQMITSEVATAAPILSLRLSASSGNPIFGQYVSSGTAASPTAVASGRSLGRNNWYGFDGTNYINAASLLINVDGTPGTNNMPGRITFLTTPSGSATPLERMRIDSSGNVGIGTSNPTQLLDVNGNVAISGLGRRILGDFGNGTFSNRLAFQSSTTNGPTFVMALPNGSSQQCGLRAVAQSDPTNSSWIDIFADATVSSTVSIRSGIWGTGTYLPLAFHTGGSERMRIDSSGNVLIGGTTNPTAAKVNIISDGSVTNRFLSFTNTQASGRTYQFVNGGGTAGLFQIYDATADAGRLLIDASGNLGLGVTPSATVSDFKSLELGSAGNGIFCGTSGYDNTIISSNAYVSGASLASTYGTNGPAAQYHLNQGAHAWYTAPSGTAGNAITFTQAMTLNASGNLLVGTTSGNAKINVSDNSTYEFRIGYNVSSDRNLNLRAATGYNASISFTEEAVLDKWTLGTKSGDNALIFATGSNLSTGTERARITSGGYFKASNNGSYNDINGSWHEVYQSANDYGFVVTSTNSGLTNDATLAVTIQRNTTNNTFYAIGYYNTGGGAWRFRVADSGDVTNTNGTYGTISDAKMKTDIVDAGSQWDDIKALRFRKFKMKNDPSGLVQLGVVAQEVEEVSPGLVDEHADRDADGNDLGTTTKSVKTSVLLMKAAVALQEAMTRIEALEAEVQALKSK